MEMNDNLQKSGKAYDISVEDDFVFLRIRPGNTIDADLILSMLADLYSYEAYQSETEGGLWIFCGCHVDLKYEDLKKIRDFIDAKYDPNWSHKYTAFVVDRDTQYGFARMYDTMADRLPTVVKIFREEQPARDWLRSKAGKTVSSSS